jgi:hypothetical protein
MINNVIIISVIAILIGVLGYKFFKLSKAKQIKIISEWLLLAVIKAEKELGNGTGQVKLRYVYDLFLDKFKFASMIISFAQFSGLVDLALITMKEMISNNGQVKDYIEKK